MSDYNEISMCVVSFFGDTKLARYHATNGDSCMHFNFDKEIPKITLSCRGSKLKLGNFVSVTASEAGLV